MEVDLTLEKSRYPTYDANGNITAITNALDATKNKSFTYDALDRISTATASGLWGSLAWTYDGVGNRLTEGSTVYSYTPGTNKLSGVGGSTYSFDSDGNTTSDGTRGYTYNQNQRLLQAVNGATTANYTYNGNGQRVKKIVNGVTTVFHYSLRGQLISESDGIGAAAAEYVYLNSKPLAKIEGTNVYYYTTDHLGTPQKMTDSTSAVVWSADYKPFGEATITVNTITNNLMLPGQYNDAETGLYQNWNRDYNWASGGYIESDPIGIQGGKNHLYVYAGNNPILFTDPFGLAKMCCRLLNSFVFGSTLRQRHCYIVADDGTRYGLYPENGLGVPRTNDPRDTGGDCYDCPARPLGGCINQNKCLSLAHGWYPKASYSRLGPNSNTYAGSLARTCCQGGVPSGVHDTPGVNDQAPGGH